MTTGRKARKMSVGIRHDDLRRRNRAMVLSAVRRAGQPSRTEIAATTGLSHSTISAISSDLIGEGILAESKFTAGPDFTIADIVHYGWMWRRDFAGIDFAASDGHTYRRMVARAPDGSGILAVWDRTNRYNRLHDKARRGVAMRRSSKWRRHPGSG